MRFFLVAIFAIAGGLCLAMAQDAKPPAPELTVDESTALFHATLSMQKKLQDPVMKEKIAKIQAEFDALFPEREEQNKIIQKFEKDHEGWTVQLSANGGWTVVAKAKKP